MTGEQKQDGHWSYVMGDGKTSITTAIHVPTDQMLITLTQTTPEGVTTVIGGFSRETMRRVYQNIGEYLIHGPYNESKG